MSVPEAFTITVHEESRTDVHIVAPGAIDHVPDDDLELVAGGMCWDDSCRPRAPEQRGSAVPEEPTNG